MFQYSILPQNDPDMSLTKLETLLPRPTQPQEVGTLHDWTNIEAELKTTLPNDYKGFIGVFGSGTINDFLVVLNPFSPNKYINLLQRGRMELDAYAASKKSFPEHYAHDIYPTSGGLLPFGATDNGEILYWNTTGNPNHWSVVAYESRGPKHFTFGGNMTEFLTRLLEKTIECSVLPRSFPSAAPVFVSMQTS
jgi:SMI1-KNR4 cell-wall